MRSGAIALLFLAAYGVSALAPFVIISPASAYSSETTASTENRQNNQNQQSYQDSQKESVDHNNQDSSKDHANGNPGNNAQPEGQGQPNTENEGPQLGENGKKDSESHQSNTDTKDQGAQPGETQQGDQGSGDNSGDQQGDEGEGGTGGGGGAAIRVTAETPTKVDSCGTNDTYTIPDVIGVQYYIDNTTVEPGTFSTNGALSLAITAKAKEGYRLTHQREWELSFTNVLCGIAVAIPTDPVVVCGANNDIVTLPTVAHVSYSQTGWEGGTNTVTATADEGYYISGTEGETTIQWTFKDDATLCAITVAVPVDPTIVCGANNDVVTVPTSAHVTYTQTGWVNGKNTITATTDPGYYIVGTQGLTTQSWTYTDANTSCGQVLGDSTTTPNVLAVSTTTSHLENTGNSIVLPMLLSTGVLGLAIMTVQQNSLRKSKFVLLAQQMLIRFKQVLEQPFIVPTA